MRKTMHLYYLICFTGLALSIASYVYAGGGRIEMSSENGVATQHTALITATLYTDDSHTQASVGELGMIHFENPEHSSQYCNTFQSTSDSQGKIKAQCHSSYAGQYVAKLQVSGGEERTVAMLFTSPAPTPMTQVLSGQYYLTPSQSSVTFTNERNTGYGINVTLRDQQSNEVIIDQSQIDYDWQVQNGDIVKISEIGQMCISPVQPPSCPAINGQFYGYKPGTTSVKVMARKNGQVLAETSITMQVNQTTTGESYYSAPATPRPAASATPSPSPIASPKVIASAQPKATTASPTIFATTEPTPTPSSPSPSPSVMIDFDATGAAQTGQILPIILILLSIVLGLGLPIGWYVLETNPVVKKRVMLQLHVLKRRFGKSAS